MAVVPTIKGDVDSADLGPTLMHEHVFVLDMEIEENYPGRWDEETRIDDAIARLQSLADTGVGTIVDLTVVGLGRSISRVQRVAEHVDLNIIAATGLYTFNSLPVFFRHRGPGTIGGGSDLLEKFFLRDIQVGIADTGIRAGVLKCATDREGLTPDVERVLRAVARAHLATGVPISTHTDVRTERGLDQQRVFADEGVDLGRVIIGHSGDSTDLDYLRKLIDNGSYLGMDRFGVDVLLPLEERVDTVATLCEQGYADRLVLSHDESCFTHHLDLDVKSRIAPRHNYEYIPRVVVPTLLERGVAQADIDQMLIANPRSIFEAAG